MSTYNIYLALIAQLDKLARHNRQGSFQTKRRYYEAMQRFCRYLAEEYHLQKLSNISGANPLDAHFTVSRLLGHERADVTTIYLASVKKKEARDGE